MSNHCRGCRFDPALSIGESACPFTTLYWDFLLRHEPVLTANPRMGMQLKNLARLSADQRGAIVAQATHHRQAVAAATPKASTP
jgi:deoxyribodipyrimidine photolyase-related protein